MWLAGAVAITGAPPFALFLSELTIIRAGLSTSKYFLIGLMAVLLVIIFVGFLNHFRTMYFENGEAADQTPAPCQRVVPSADVARACAAIDHGAVVASGSLGSFPDHRAGPPANTSGGGRPMIGTRVFQLSPDDLRPRAEALHATGGRLQFAYAWFPAGEQPEVRYVSSIPDQHDFDMWVVTGQRELPSLG